MSAGCGVGSPPSGRTTPGGTRPSVLKVFMVVCAPLSANAISENSGRAGPRRRVLDLGPRADGPCQVRLTQVLSHRGGPVLSAVSAVRRTVRAAVTGRIVAVAVVASAP